MITIDIARVTGEIWYEGIDVNRPDINVYEMRKHIGMVFQRPNPFAKSIYRNITFLTSGQVSKIRRSWTRSSKNL